MFICLDCGRLIEDDEYEVWTEPHGEQVEGCPYCHGGLAEAHKCIICEEYHTEEELTNGICEHCEKNDFEYGTALKYLVETGRLREFFLIWYWQAVDSVNDDENEELDGLLIKVFKAKEEEDKVTFKNAFYSELKEYIFSDIYDWTEFLQKIIEEGGV